MLPWIYVSYDCNKKSVIKNKFCEREEQKKGEKEEENEEQKKGENKEENEEQKNPVCVSVLSKYYCASAQHCFPNLKRGDTIEIMPVEAPDGRLSRTLLDAGDPDAPPRITVKVIFANDASPAPGKIFSCCELFLTNFWGERGADRRR